MSHAFQSATPEPGTAPAKSSRSPIDGKVDELTVSVHADPTEVEAIWRALETTAPRSLYQRYDWLQAWCETAGQALGVEPAIVVGSLGSQPLFLLPLGRHKTRLGRTLVWLGGSHVNSAMALFDPGFAAELDADGARQLFRRAIEAVGRFDYALLCNQPYSWSGHANPLRHLPGLVEDQPVMVISLEGGFDAVLNRHSGARKRKKLRWQENALKPVGGYRFHKAETPEQALDLFDRFLAQKSEQFARAGIDNVFAEPGAAAFFRELVARSFALGEPLIEFYGVEIDGAVRATFAGGLEASRFQGYFSAMSLDEWQRISPGELLLHHLVRGLCDRGCQVLDFGVGDERYKSSWDALPQRQFTTYVAGTLRGRVVVAGLRTMRAVRVKIRSNKTAWAVAKKVRRAIAAIRGRSAD